MALIRFAVNAACGSPAAGSSACPSRGRFLADPRILILDEATSALDSQTEALIQQALERLMAGRTTFVIAHRLSTIMNADMIVVMDQGRVVEKGSHAELLRRHGMYFRMFREQYGKASVGAGAPMALEGCAC